MDQNNFHIWTTYWGKLIQDQANELESTLYGLENISSDHQQKNNFNLTGENSIWGFVTSGSVLIKTPESNWNVNKDQWFNIFGNDIDFSLSENTRLFFIATNKFKSLSSMGGPIEDKGRLQYIDGCTDTLLACPALQGDPCLNLLHFPPGIDQTMHTHPSIRTGIVSSGTGTCVTEKDHFDLKPGTIFFLPVNTKHNFKTGDGVLNVISYHPDSDWGPTHEVHPMINRTWVDGKKISQD